MRTCRTSIGIENLSHRGRIEVLADTLVDTGSGLTWIPRAILEGLGVKAERRRDFGATDGSKIERDIGFAIVHAGGVATADIVVFGEPDDLVLLGARSLQGLNLRLDAGGKILVDAGPVLAAGIQEAQGIRRWSSHERALAGHNNA